MKKIFCFITAALLTAPAWAQNFVITQHGASKDSNQLNTAVIQQLIDSISENGGGTIVIPKGVYLTGALFFKKRTHLQLEEGAVLKGSDDINNYPLIPSRMEGQSQYYYAALINAYFTDSFSITGPGTIDGNGLRYWKAFWDHREAMKKIGKSSTNLEVHRPRLVFIWGSNHISIRNVQLHNSGFWTTHLYQCKDVLIADCDIRSPFKPVPAPSTDGVDIDVCSNVTIRHCYISVNDDAVCIKGGKGPDAHTRMENGPGENIVVEDCTFGDAHACLTLGSECIHANNIIMRRCTVNSNTPLLHLKMRPDTYQVFENVSIENITGKCGMLISMAPWKQFFNLNGSNEKPFGTIKNITFSNINMQCNTVGEIVGNAPDKVSGILFQQCNITAVNPVLKNVYAGVKADHVIVNGTNFEIK